MERDRVDGMERMRNEEEGEKDGSMLSETREMIREASESERG